MAHYPKFTPARVEKFLQALEASANATLAAQAAGISKRSAYNWRRDNEVFAQQWADALETAIERLEAEAWRRAMGENTEDVYYGGKVVGKRRVYSDKILMFLLAGLKPEKYRDTYRGPGEPQAPVSIVFQAQSDEAA